MLEQNAIEDKLKDIIEYAQKHGNRYSEANDDKRVTDRFLARRPVYPFCLDLHLAEKIQHSR